MGSLKKLPISNRINKRNIKAARKIKNQYLLQINLLKIEIIVIFVKTGEILFVVITVLDRFILMYVYKDIALRIISYFKKFLLRMMTKTGTVPDANLSLIKEIRIIKLRFKKLVAKIRPMKNEKKRSMKNKN